MAHPSMYICIYVAHIKSFAKWNSLVYASEFLQDLTCKSYYSSKHIVHLCISYSTLPATQAVRKQAALPAIMALTITFAMSCLLPGAMPPRAPIATPIDPMLANPQSA